MTANSAEITSVLEAGTFAGLSLKPQLEYDSDDVPFFLMFNQARSIGIGRIEQCSDAYDKLAQTLIDNDNGLAAFCGVDESHAVAFHKTSDGKHLIWLDPNDGKFKIPVNLIRQILPDIARSTIGYMSSCAHKGVVAGF